MRLSNEFEVREPSPLSNEGTEITLVRITGQREDVWTLTWLELADIFMQTKFALQKHREDLCDHEWQNYLNFKKFFVLKCPLCGAEKMEERNSE